jgi:hypothetical protein
MASSPVAEIHLAGHVHCGDIVIDDHGSRVCADVWTLYRHAIARFGAVPTLIEWDTDVPPLAVLLDEAKRARATATAALQPVHAGGLRRTPLAQDVAGNHTPVCPEELGCDARRKTRRWANPTSGLQRRSAPKSDGANGESYFLPHPPQQVLLGALLAVPRSPLAASARAALANEVLTPWERGLNAYQANGHDSAKRSLLAAYPVVAALIGDDSFALMAREFWHRHPPVRGDLACWGEALSGFVAANLQLADVPYLADVARVEWALHRAAGAPDATADLASFALVTRADPDTLTLQLPPGTVVVISEWPVASLVTAHGVGEPSMEVAAARVQTRQGECAVVWRQGLRPRVAPCTHAAAALLQALVRGCSLPASLNDALEADPDFDLGPWLNAAVADGLVLGASPLPRPGEAISLAAPLAA